MSLKIKQITTKALAEILDARLIGDNCLVDMVSIDTREKIDNKFCFFAIKGKKYNGEDYIKDAISNGAKVIVTESEIASDVTTIIVKDVKEALLKLGSYNKGSVFTIAVTGSVGKTTVKEMIKSVLSESYNVTATPLNNNNEIGVAQTLLSVKNEDFCIVEMGMRALGEIRELSRFASPKISIITNAGNSHIERLGSEENIFKAKCEILEYTSDYAIVPSEERFKNLSYGNVKPIFVGNRGDIEALDIKLNGQLISFKIRDNLSKCEIITNIRSHSFHDCQNALFAYCVGKLCGIAVEKINSGILKFKNCKNRGEIRIIKGITIIDDCYNASFESMKSAIFSLSRYAKENHKKAYAVIGDMLEIGALSSEYHYKVGEYARKNSINGVLCYGDFAKFTCEGFGGGILFSSKGEIENYIYENFSADDVLLIKASRGAELETIIEGLEKRENEA